MTKNKYFYPGLAAIIGLAVALQVVGPLLFNDGVVQDDFRQSMFWVWRFWDPSLFPNDLIADLYTDSFDRLPFLLALYKIAPFLTGNLVWFSKIVAIILAGLTTVTGYLFFEKLSANRLHAIAFSLALAVTLWCTDHLSAVHARSFIWFFVFVYGYLKVSGNNLIAHISIFISLFISPIAFLMCLVMEGFDLLINATKDILNPKSIRFAGLAVNSIAVLILYKVIDWHSKLVPFPDGEPYSLAEIKTLAEFNPGGRHPIFGSSIWDGSWWMNEHWGMGIGFLPISKIVILAGILALVYILFYHKEIQLTKILKSVPAMLFYASISLYLAAQVLFPLLYMPSRFIGISSIILSLLVIFFVLARLFEDIVVTFAAKAFKDTQKAVAILLLIFACGYWFYYSKPQHQFTRYVAMNPQVKKIYDNLATDVMIAGHPMLPDLNMLSAISKRSIFMSYEHSRPYFYNRQIMEEIRRRNEASLRMVYASSAQELLDLMEANNITHVIAHMAFYSPQYLANPRYTEPYAGLLRELIAKRKFYLYDFMQKYKVSYSLVTPKALREEIGIVN